MSVLVYMPVLVYMSVLHYLRTSVGLTDPLRMSEVTTAVASVRGRMEDTHCSQAGMEVGGQRTPDRRKRGKMRASATWIASALKSQTVDRAQW